MFAVGAPTKPVEEVPGRPEEDFESIARRYLNNPELIVHGYSARTKVGAIVGMVKMMDRSSSANCCFEISQPISPG